MRLLRRNWRVAFLAVLAGIVVVVAVPGAFARSAEAPLPQTSDEILLEPASATPFLGDQLTLTATLHENAGDCCGVDVRFVVLDGPNAGTTQTVKSDASGVASFTYTSSTAGTDQIQAQYHDNSERSDKGSNIVPVAWQRAAVGVAVPGRPPALVQTPDQTTFTGADPTQDLPKGTVVDISGDRAISILNYAGDQMTFLGVPDRVTSRFQLLSGVRSYLGTIVMKLTGGNFKQCTASPTTRFLSSYGSIAKTKKPVRRLWGSGKGQYKTQGKYASATVLGTFWEIADFCDGTLIHVREGTVRIFDFTKHKSVVITTGQTYFAQAPK